MLMLIKAHRGDVDASSAFAVADEDEDGTADDGDSDDGDDDKGSK